MNYVFEYCLRVIIFPIIIGAVLALFSILIETILSIINDYKTRKIANELITLALKDIGKKAELKKITLKVQYKNDTFLTLNISLHDIISIVNVDTTTSYKCSMNQLFVLLDNLLYEKINFHLADSHKIDSVKRYFIKRKDFKTTTYYN